MLVLARKRNQSIVIADNIEIFIVDINNDQVKIGIKAPKEVSIHRKEVYESIKKEMKEAAESPVAKLKDLKHLKFGPKKDVAKNSG